MVVSPYEERPSVGRANYLYEATLLTDDAPGVVSRIFWTTGHSLRRIRSTHPHPAARASSYPLLLLWLCVCPLCLPRAFPVPDRRSTAQAPCNQH